MIEMNALIGAGNTCANSSEMQEHKGLLSTLENQLGNAGSPTLAFQLMMQKQALEDRVRYKNWLAHARDNETPTQKEVETTNLIRRAHFAVMV